MAKRNRKRRDDSSKVSPEIGIRDDGKDVKLEMPPGEHETRSHGIFPTTVQQVFADGKPTGGIVVDRYATLVEISGMQENFSAFENWLSERCRLASAICLVERSEWQEEWGDYEATISDARLLFFWDMSLRLCVRDGCMFKAMAYSLEIGRILQRLPIRQFEAAVSAHKNSVAGSRKVAVKRTKKANARHEKWKTAVADEIAKQKAGKRPLNYDEAVKAVAENNERNGEPGGERRIKAVVPNIWTARPKK